MLRQDEVELVARTAAQAKTMGTARLAETLASMKRNLGASGMLCTKPGVAYTTPAGRAAVYDTIDAELGKRGW